MFKNIIQIEINNLRAFCYTNLNRIYDLFKTHIKLINRQKDYIDTNRDNITELTLHYQEQRKLNELRFIRMLTEMMILKNELTKRQHKIYKVTFKTEQENLYIEDFYICESEEKAYTEAKQMELPIVKIEEV